jgi:IS1 family transposase
VECGLLSVISCISVGFGGLLTITPRQFWRIVLVCVSISIWMDDLLVLFSVFRIKCVYCDDDFAYQSRVRDSVVLLGKCNMQCVGRKYLFLRIWCSRLVRRGVRFSKLEVMHHTVVGLIINFWFFKRKLPFNLL